MLELARAILKTYLVVVCNACLASTWTWSSKAVCRCVCKVLGHVAFRNQLLVRYGTAVTIPYNPDSSTVESMAADMKAAVEAKTGLPLDSFRS